MVSAFSRGFVLFAALSMAMLSAANGANIPSLVDTHREAVDEQAYPWSAVGKLFNETGASCSGVVIARDKILTAAHCLYNDRRRSFIPADALHFLVGYRTGRYSAHARISRYEIGAGFDPVRYDRTAEADWAVLTVTELLPLDIEPLRLRRDIAPRGTRAVLVGYPQDRAFAMTADSDCELGAISTGYLVHSCRGIKGYSGAPILVSTGGREMQVAGIQIASLRSDGSEKMIAVPAQTIWSYTADDSVDIAAATAISLEDIRARFDLGPLETAATADTAMSAPEPSGKPVTDIMASLAFEQIAAASP